jgi:iron complex outermembrane receptor protein
LELGVKHSLSEDTSYTLAVYSLKHAIPTQIGPDTAIFQSEKLVSGLEFSVNSKLSPSLSVASDVAWLDASHDKYYQAETGEDASNLAPFNVPEVMINFRASYQFESQPIEVGGGMNYVSSRWADAMNTVKLKAFNTYKLFIAYHGNNYHVALHINNVTDEIYGPWSDIYYPNQILLAPPRTIDLSYRVNF